MQSVILVDIDGTIALRGDRGAHDHDQAMEDGVNWDIVNIVESLYYKYNVILVSGRDEKYRVITEYWLHAHGIMPYRLALLMRPLGDNRPDEVVKEEIYKQQIWPHYKVVGVFDDRDKVVAMWRRLGLTCLQVADGAY